jgi:hypothetical protein
MSADTSSAGARRTTNQIQWIVIRYRGHPSTLALHSSQSLSPNIAMVDTATASIFSTLVLQAIIGVLVYLIFEYWRGLSSFPCPLYLSLLLSLPLSASLPPSLSMSLSLTSFLHRTKRNLCTQSTNKTSSLSKSLPSVHCTLWMVSSNRFPL